MKVIFADSPDHGLAQGLAYLAQAGSLDESRNGPVLVAPGPVTTVYTTPWNHVSRNPVRDANPFFHLAEAMWMLLGRKDVALPAKFAASMRDFSDDGKELWGAYGFRWRYHFNKDQLDAIVSELTANPKSRRAVLSMWDGHQDPGVAVSGGRDVPCNTHAYFSIANGQLNMTVCCRSNDIVWGAYGANVVHFSILLQYMAERLGVGIGTYFQMSNNYHAYAERPDVKALLATPGALSPKYPAAEPIPKLMLTGADNEAFLNDVDGALSSPLGRTYTSPFVSDVLVPMLLAHMAHKAGHTEMAMGVLQSSCSWHRAGREWLSRRLVKQAEKKETR